MATLVLDLLLYVAALAVLIAASEAADEADDDDVDNCASSGDLVAKRLRLHDDVCDTWLPRLNATEITQLCRKRAGLSALLTSVCGDVSMLCAHAECRRHESVRSALEFACNGSSLAVYATNEQCLLSDALRQQLDSACSALLLNSSTLLGLVGHIDTTTVDNQCRKCNVTARCMTAAVRSACGDEAADWLTELVYHVRAPYVTCWTCSHSVDGDATPARRYRVSGWVALLPCACALLFSLCTYYLWHVYRRRLRYVKTKLREATITIYVTDDVTSADQSHASNHAGSTHAVIPADACPPDSPTGYAPLVDPAIVPFLQPVTTTQLN